jgi:hypothetical protein
LRSVLFLRCTHARAARTQTAMDTIAMNLGVMPTGTQRAFVVLYQAR